MACVPRPVKSSSEKKGDELPPSPASFIAGSLFSERRPPSFNSIDSRTGLVAYEAQGDFPQGSLPPDRERGPVNGIHQEDVPRKSTDMSSGLQRADELSRDRSPSPVSIYSQTSTTETGTALGNPSLVQNMPSRSFISSGLMYSVPLPTTPNGSPSGNTHGGATFYTPARNSSLGHYPVRVTIGDKLQPAQTYPRPQRVASRSHSFHSTASVHSKWAASTPHVPPPPVIAPGATRSRGPGAFAGPQGPSPAYKAPSRTWESNPTVKRNITEPTRTVQRYGVGLGRRSYIPPVAGRWQQSAGDVQLLNQAQWQRLVLTAAAKP
jgi:hypothetical protein